MRKENQLFPKLESHSVTGPSSVMWAIHDDIRALLKKAKKEVAEANPNAVNSIEQINTTIRDMI